MSQFTWQNISLHSGDQLKNTNVKESSPNSIDNAHGDTNIANISAEKYKELYNSVPSNDEFLSDIQTKLNILINDKCCTNNCNFDHLIRQILRGE